MHHAVILAGGAGTRLWPMSRAALPKQLIPLFGGRSLLHLAVERLAGLVARERTYICTGEKYRAAIRAALPEIDDEHLLGEPEGRDTLAAVALSAAVVAKHDADATIAILTADHLIRPVDAFQRRLATAYRVAETSPDTLVTFGVEPTYPATAYGYIARGAALAGYEGVCRAERFVEKPDAATAAEYLASGRFAWNSGMFVWRADTVLRAIARFKPQVHAGAIEIAKAWDTPDRARVLARVYPTLEKKSVDFGLMEPASVDRELQVATVSLPIEWLDVGSWNAFAETVAADADGNRVASEAALLLDCRNVLVASDDPQHLIGAIGIEDLIVVHTADATLICRRERVEDIKRLHAAIADRCGTRYL